MSTNPRIYLDYNATMPMVSAAREAMVSALAQGLGNPSSVHADGRRARDVVERARDQVARLVSRPREQIVFTSGGTEANALGVLGLAAVVEKRGGPRVVASAAIDHPSLLGAVQALVARGWEHRPIAVDHAGRLGIVTVGEPIPVGEPRTSDRYGALDGVGVVALSAVNHELGTVLGLGPWTVAAMATGVLVHVDAVQLAGKRAVATHAHSIAISAHKIGGPHGVGALAISIDEGLPLIESGHQERERRGGTENTIGIAGFGAAAAGIDLAAWPRVVDLGARLEAGLVALGARINGVADPIAKSMGGTTSTEGTSMFAVESERIGGTINAAFAGVRGESIVIALDLAGISCSTGAACTSGSIQPSKVLLALGQSPDQAREAVRFSLGTPTTNTDIDAVLAALPAILARARR
jgi:cysteine desulfurase